MAGLAVSARGAPFKLAVMNVFVAVAAESMGYGCSEIIVLVAFGAGGLNVFAVQRELRTVVIKVVRR